MRFDTPVYFQSITTGEYDALSGDYGDDIVTEVCRYASVTPSGINTLKLVYGEIKQGSFTVRIQSHYEEDFDRIRINDKIYRVDMERKLRNVHIFIVSEVQ